MLWCFVKCCGVLHFRATVEIRYKQTVTDPAMLYMITIRLTFLILAEGGEAVLWKSRVTSERRAVIFPLQASKMPVANEIEYNNNK